MSDKMSGLAHGKIDPIDTKIIKDYKQPERNGTVSVSVLVEYMDKLDMHLKRANRAMYKVKRELDAIIEEIGEEW